MPDIAILRGPESSQYSREKGLPTAADIGLIVEVADRSYAKDRRENLFRYAATGIPCYWIVSLRRRRVEVFLQPERQGQSAVYLQSTVFGEDQEVPIVLDGTELGVISVSKILEEV